MVCWDVTADSYVKAEQWLYSTEVASRSESVSDCCLSLQRQSDYKAHTKAAEKIRKKLMQQVRFVLVQPMR